MHEFDSKNPETLKYKVHEINSKKTTIIKQITKKIPSNVDQLISNNIRDIGGKPTKDNKIVKCKLIYRGSFLENKGKDLINLLRDELKIKTELDLRNSNETQRSDSLLGKDVHYYNKPIDGYSGLFTNYSGHEFEDTKAIFELFLKPKKYAPIYMHCVGGADRTGTIAFLLGGVLGMSYVDLIIDYELTSFSGGLREYNKKSLYGDFPSLIKYLKNITNHKDEENPNIQQMCEEFLINKVKFSKRKIKKLRKLYLQ